MKEKLFSGHGSEVRKHWKENLSSYKKIKLGRPYMYGMVNSLHACMYIYIQEYHYLYAIVLYFHTTSYYRHTELLTSDFLLPSDPLAENKR